MPMMIVSYTPDGLPTLNLTETNRKLIMNGDPIVTINWLLENQIIEYLSIEEAHNCLAA